MFIIFLNILWLLDLNLFKYRQETEIRGHVGIQTTQILAYAGNVVILIGTKSLWKKLWFNIDSEAVERWLKINDNQKPLKFENHEFEQQVIFLPRVSNKLH